MRESLIRRCTLLAALAVLGGGAFGASAGTASVSASRDHGKSGGDHTSKDDGKSGQQTVSSGHGDDQTGQGVVQSVSSSALVLKTLDGSVVTVPVDSRTRVLVADRPAAIADVKPGFVVTATWKDGGQAEEVDALDPAPKGGGVSIVVSVRPDRVVLTTSDGGTATIRPSGKARVFVDGKPAKLQDVKPGYILAGAGGSKQGRPVGDLHFLRR